MTGTHDGGVAHGEIVIDNGLFDISIDAPHHDRIDNIHKDADGVGPIQIDIAHHNPYETLGHDDHVGGIAQW